jgi:ERCC4-type nuclease
VHYHYTDGELKTLLQSLTVLVDTREQENSHILAYFDKQSIPRKSRKLDYGDYSFYLPASPDMGILRDLHFTDGVAIERKASLEELSGNLTHDRARFEAELIRANKAKLFLMVEDANYADIVEHKYKTQFAPKAFIAAIKTFESRYNLNVNFIPSQLAGNFIYYTLLYHLREYLKNVN